MTRGLRVQVSDGRARLIRSGRAVTLRTATEHYGALLNRAFDFGAYLPMLARSGCNLTRTFVLFRELQSAQNPYSTCKPESIDYIAPYARIRARRGDRLARDGQPLFDLDAWDPEFFDRLHDFAGEAERYDITVELTIFSNAYHEAVWSLNPLHHENNVNGLPAAHWAEHTTARYPARLDRHLGLIAKVVAECAEHPNVIFEACNEPGGDAPLGPERAPVTAGEVNDWQQRMIAAIRATDAGRHLVAGQQAFSYEPWRQPLDDTGRDLEVDVVNVHPLPGTVLGGRTFDLGRFMSGDLTLRNLQAFCAEAARCGRPVNLDEDNCASQYTNRFGWTVHRKRAWVTTLSGCHYDMIDFTIRPHLPIGAPTATGVLRAWTWFLGLACERWAVATGTLSDAATMAGSDTTIMVCCAVPSVPPEPVGPPGSGPALLLVYLADATERTPDEPAAEQSAIRLQLSGREPRHCSFYSPATGALLAERAVAGGADSAVVDLDLPDFTDDLLVVVSGGGPASTV